MLRYAPRRELRLAGRTRTATYGCHATTGPIEPSSLKGQGREAGRTFSPAARYPYVLVEASMDGRLRKRG